jgi:apolipoprotein D and lipocalin family protein
MAHKQHAFLPRSPRIHPDVSLARHRAVATPKVVEQPLPTVDYVDLYQYAGRWFELARLPSPLQPDDSLAIIEYRLSGDGGMLVRNSVYRERDGERYLRGKATLAKGAEDSHARFKMHFAGRSGFDTVPDEGNYWVIDLAEDYSMALVGSPDRTGLWLLGREPYAFEVDTGDAFLMHARRLGFDIAHLLIDHWESGTTLPRPIAI